MVKTQEQYAAEYQVMQDEDLLIKYGIDCWAEDRCVGEKEREENRNSIAAATAEILKRMSKA